LGREERLLEMIKKLEENRQKEYDDLAKQLKEMNTSLKQLNKFIATNINTALGQKSIPYQSGRVSIPSVLLEKPSNPDDYTIQVNVYAENNSRPVERMTMINDGPGDIFFITAVSRDQFGQNEEVLHPNDLRMLFNVYEIRLRTNLPLTTFRLIEGEMRTGSFAPGTKANIEIRPEIQANEVLKNFYLIFDVKGQPINITSPTVQNLVANYVGVFDPLPPGNTAAFVDLTTGIPMPFTIPEGFIAEAFSYLGNFSTDFTLRNWVELVPGSDIFFNQGVIPASNRGYPFNFVPNLASQFSTDILDPEGAPSPGRKTLFTITNDDPFNNMIGFGLFEVILRRLV
jgi:hypothetical protein